MQFLLVRLKEVGYNELLEETAVWTGVPIYQYEGVKFRRKVW
jgi:hypothetical protein